MLTQTIFFTLLASTVLSAPASQQTCPSSYKCGNSAVFGNGVKADRVVIDPNATVISAPANILAAWAKANGGQLSGDTLEFALPTCKKNPYFTVKTPEGSFNIDFAHDGNCGVKVNIAPYQVVTIPEKLICSAKKA